MSWRIEKCYEEGEKRKGDEKYLLSQCLAGIHRERRCEDEGCNIGEQDHCTFQMDNFMCAGGPVLVVNPCQSNTFSGLFKISNNEVCLLSCMNHTVSCFNVFT